MERNFPDLTEGISQTLEQISCFTGEMLGAFPLKLVTRKVSDMSPLLLNIIPAVKKALKDKEKKTHKNTGKK